MKRTVRLAAVAGFCVGVRRAVRMAEKAGAERAGAVTTLGMLVHNSRVIERLRESGIAAAGALDEISAGTVVLSAHGSSPETIRRAQERGLDIVDAVCPFVTRVHRAAKDLVATGYEVILVGDPGHTEVEGVLGTLSDLGGKVTVVWSEEQIKSLRLSKRVGIISQTTQRTETFASIVAAVCKVVPDVRALNTVCGATEELQEAARDLAREVEVMFVIGGRKSANTTRLRELCEEQGATAYHIETAAEIEPEWLDGKSAIGITAGASTPDWQIEEVARQVNGGLLPEGWNVHHPDE